jgi:recombination protein RecA
MGDSHMGLQARLMSQALGKLTSTISARTPVLFLSTSCAIKSAYVWFAGTTTGGKALKFYASVRMTLDVSARLKKAIR